MSDIASEIAALRTKRDNIAKGLESKKSTLAVLKQQYADKKEYAKKEFGVETPDAINEKVATMSAALKEQAELLNKAMKFYEAGDYAAVDSLLEQEPKP